MLVSEIEKNPEQMINRATAQSCAHKGKDSKRMGGAGGALVAMRRHYSRAKPRFGACLLDG